ncbi:MAG TPA: (2Fe-2S)-binding protein [Polyangium sp.]|nr:(2Fe-2S)-binding protein [Polyangium sp.]
MYVCICMAVTEKDIRDAAASGLSSPTEIMEKTGAGSRCGTCRSTVASILDGSATKESPCASRRFRTYSAALLPSV